MATFVLVHGAWHGGWCWDRVAPLLRGAGHEVHAPTLTGLSERAHLLSPLVGLDTHVEDVVRLIDTFGLRDVVLVGHSYAGQVVTTVADRRPPAAPAGRPGPPRRGRRPPHRHVRPPGRRPGGAQLRGPGRDRGRRPAAARRRQAGLPRRLRRRRRRGRPRPAARAGGAPLGRV